jgi:hypothetical protein
MTLGNCSYLEEDDHSYLQDDTVWVDSRAEKLTSEEKGALFNLVVHLRAMESDLINSRYLAHIFKDCFTKEYMQKLSEDKRKDKVKAVFMAAVVRELILRKDDRTETEAARSRFKQEYSFLLSQEGSNTELTWLNRYARSLKILATLLVPSGNKQTYINIGANLEGSSAFIEYATGGANRPETQRRVDIYIQMTKIIPKARNFRSPRTLSSSTRKRSFSGTPKSSNSDKPFMEKRKRGRPRKYPFPEFANNTPRQEDHSAMAFANQPIQTFSFYHPRYSGGGDETSYLESERECSQCHEYEEHGTSDSEMEMELPFDQEFFQGDFLLAQQKTEASAATTMIITDDDCNDDLLDNLMNLPISPPKPFPTRNSLLDFSTYSS